MKKLVLILGGVVAIALFSTTLPCGNQVFAISGCCKERASLSRGWTKQPPRIGINECKKKNRKDRDNVFDASGLVWWDVKCRP